MSLKMAVYSPELAQASPDWFGMSAVGVDGQQCHLGDRLSALSPQRLSSMHP